MTPQVLQPRVVTEVAGALGSLSRLQRVVNGLSSLERHHYLAGTDMRENVAGHSLSVATFAWFLHQHIASQANLELVVRYAVVHDFLEVYAGDVSTFANAESRTAKEQQEEVAYEQFCRECAPFPALLDDLRAYQDRADDEAQFVWTADKIQALVHGRMDAWRPYYEDGITFNAFSAKYAELLHKASPELQPLFAEIIEECKQTYRRT